VPEALPRVLIRLRERLGVESVDRLWIFPPSRSGRKEHGLIAVSAFLAGEERRGLVTVSYSAEHTGKGVTVETSFTEEGEAPPDRFSGVMQGVVQRVGDQAGEPREIEIGGSPQKYEGLLEEFDDELLQGVSIGDDRP
ncbi:MAG: hypothetical protein PVJ80_09165, partial [Gemmatimonadota bacterium]